MASKRLKKKHAKEWLLCPLCGRKLPQDVSLRVVGQTGRAVCSDCLTVSKYILNAPRPHPKAEADPGHILIPKEIMEQLDRAIIGQEEAKRAVAIAFWKQQLRARGVEIPAGNLLLYGPTGCGKTALVREAARIVGIPFLTFDATTLTEAGYRGRSANDMVIDLTERCGREKAAYGVIFVDEIDKLAATADNIHRASYNRGTQHSLLKLIEGSDITVDGEAFSTAGILFCFGGAFSGLRKELEEVTSKRSIGFEREEVSVHPTQERITNDAFIRYGMEPEVMGRIGRCVPLKGLTADDLRRILLQSELSVYRQYQAFFRQQGTKLELDGTRLDDLIQKAMEMNTGARGLNSLVEEWVEPYLLRLSEDIA